MIRSTAGRVPFAALTLLAGLGALASIACSGSDDGEAPSASATLDPGTLLGTPNPLQVRKPSDTFMDTSGNPYTISTETEGFVTLLYLGYTFCPDVCPTEMAEVAAGLASLTEAERARIKVLFVTVDPDRDKPEVLREWLDTFDIDAVGLIPNNQQLTRLSRSLGMEPPRKEFIGGSYYTVSHAAFVLAFPSSGTGSYIYPLGTTPEAWAHDLKLLANGYAPLASTTR